MPTKPVRDILQRTSHRGPDACGLYADGHIASADIIQNLAFPKEAKSCLAHCRLSIVGDESAVQPLSSGPLSLVHNGEIYNYQQLRGLLEQKGALNDSQTLLSVITELYQGDLLSAVKQTVKLLNGMYAFAVTDGRDLVIARDPMGIKPVYYTEQEDSIYFCSEKKGLYGLDGAIKRVPPGMILKASSDETSLHPGLLVESPQIDITNFDQAVSFYEETLREVMANMLRGLNVEKIGMIFSGGVDSVLIAKMISDMGWDLTCYCVGMLESADVRNSKRVARDLGLELEVIPIDEATVEELLPELIHCIENNGLLQVEVAVPMYLAAQAASRDGIKVMFTGQGADELFAGYWWYKDVLRERGYLELHNRLWEDIDLLYEDTLEREDRVTMAHSVEMRVPYLDRNLVTCAMRISPQLKIKDFQDSMRKWVHREAATRLGVPEYISHRDKDAAQSGSGIHQIMETLARVHFRGREIRDASKPKDYGSLYRYLDQEYGTEEMWAYVNEVTESNHCLEGLSGVR
jgi:asparagine synthase (glutamine-hydrolysing)